MLSYSNSRHEKKPLCHVLEECQIEVLLSFTKFSNGKTLLWQSNGMNIFWKFQYSGYYLATLVLWDQRSKYMKSALDKNVFYSKIAVKKCTPFWILDNGYFYLKLVSGIFNFFTKW